MFDKTIKTAKRDQSTTTGQITRITIILGISLLVAVFVLQFGGPQAEGCSKGQSGAIEAASINGYSIQESTFLAAYRFLGFDQQDPERARTDKLREHTLNALIERSLLAQEAKNTGIRVSADDVWEHIAKTSSLFFTVSVDAPSRVAQGDSGEVKIQAFEDENNVFDPDSARRFIELRLRMSLQEFEENQMQEMLAERMRDVIRSGVRVSPREVWDAWVSEKERAKIKYVRFNARHYREASAPTDADITAWMSSHQDELNQEYERQKHRYTGLEKQVRSRYILVQADPAATDANAAKAAARAEAEALLARAKAGEDFATLARENSDDTSTARNGGDLGYRPRGRMAAAIDDAQFSLRAGQFSNVIETDEGFGFLKVEGVREGDVPEAEAKREIAERLYNEGRASERARAAAEEALRDLRGGMSMDDLNTRLTGRPNIPMPEGTPEIPEDPNAPKVEESNEFGRSDSVVEGDDGAITRAAYELTMESPLPNAPVKIGDDWVIFRLESLTLANEADFSAADRERLHQALTRGKQRDAIAERIHALRRSAEQAGEVRINDEVLRYGDEDEETEEESGSEDTNDDGATKNKAKGKATTKKNE